MLPTASRSVSGDYDAMFREWLPGEWKAYDITALEGPASIGERQCLCHHGLSHMVPDNINPGLTSSPILSGGSTRRSYRSSSHLLRQSMMARAHLGDASPEFEGLGRRGAWLRVTAASPGWIRLSKRSAC